MRRGGSGEQHALHTGLLELVAPAGSGASGSGGSVQGTDVAARQGGSDFVSVFLVLCI